mgnify:CR=1 FL=1
MTGNPLNLAKQGDPEAIALLINRSLEPKGITVKTIVSNNCLTVIAEPTASDATVPPEKAPLVELLRKGITNLNLGSIQRVVVQGRAQGKTTAAWREAFTLQPPNNLSQPVAIVTASPPTNSSTPNPSRFTKFLSIYNGVRELINTALLAGILLLLGFNALNARRTSATWEYKIEGIQDATFDLTMQQLGAEGWELVSARRALSGEGSSSSGLYEVIFKRLTNKAEAQKNIATLEQKSKESNQKVGETYAKITVGAINRAQQAVYLEKDSFASNLADTGLGIQPDSDNYIIAISSADSSKTIATATPKIADLKSYAGGVFVSGSTTVAIICASDTPTTTPPSEPTLNGDKPACAPGSSEAN